MFQLLIKKIINYLFPPTKKRQWQYYYESFRLLIEKIINNLFSQKRKRLENLIKAEYKNYYTVNQLNSIDKTTIKLIFLSLEKILSPYDNIWQDNNNWHYRIKPQWLQPSLIFLFQMGVSSGILDIVDKKFGETVDEVRLFDKGLIRKEDKYIINAYQLYSHIYQEYISKSKFSDIKSQKLDQIVSFIKRIIEKCNWSEITQHHKISYLRVIEYFLDAVIKHTLTYGISRTRLIIKGEQLTSKDLVELTDILDFFMYDFVEIVVVIKK